MLELFPLANSNMNVQKIKSHFLNQEFSIIEDAT